MEEKVSKVTKVVTSNANKTSKKGNIKQEEPEFTGLNVHFDQPSTSSDENAQVPKSKVSHLHHILL